MRQLMRVAIAVVLAAACGEGSTSVDAVDADDDEVRRSCRSAGPCIVKTMIGKTCDTQTAPDGTPCSGGVCVAGVCSPPGAPDAGSLSDAGSGPDAGVKADAGAIQLGPLGAFPRCEGAGCKTRGGFDSSAGTPRVFLVTSLATGTGAGTLGACIVASGPRVCVFTVAGRIRGASYVITNPYITIRGDTAPGMGVMLDREGATTGADVIRIQTHDVVIRGLRLRNGAVTTADDHALLIYPTSTAPIENVVLDHMSFSWGNDETVDVTASRNSAHDLTISWSIIGDAIQREEGIAAYGFMALGYDPNANSTTDIDWHHNFNVNFTKRGPEDRKRSGRYVNNLHFCAGESWFDGGQYVDYIGNMTRFGNGTGNFQGWSGCLAHSGAMVRFGFHATGSDPDPLGLIGVPGDQSVYLSGNKIYGSSATAEWDSPWVRVQLPLQGGQPRCCAQYSYNDPLCTRTCLPPERRRARLPTPASGTDIVVDAADDLPDLLLGPGGAGQSRRLDCGGRWASTGVRDAVDERLIGEFRNPPAIDSAVYAARGGVHVAYQVSALGGFPAISTAPNSATCAADSRDNSGCRCADSDQDGMPDYWESAFCGSTTGCSALGTDVAAPWTNLEAFQSGSVVAP